MTAHELASVAFLGLFAAIGALAVYFGRRSDSDPHHSWAVSALRSVAHGLTYTDAHGLEVRRILIRKVSTRHETVPVWEVLWPGAADTVWFEVREVLVDELAAYHRAHAAEQDEAGAA